MLKETAYDNHFDEVREAFLTDVSYSLLIAKAANQVITRKESQEKKRKLVPPLPQTV